MKFLTTQFPILWVALFLILIGGTGCKDGGETQASAASKTEQQGTAEPLSGEPGSQSGSPSNSTIFAPPDQMALGQSADVSLTIMDLPHKRLYYSFTSLAGAPQIVPRSGVLEVPLSSAAHLLASITASQTGVQTYTLHLTTQEGQTIDFDFSINVTAN